jgi:Family of unknown function (DUF5994)
MPEPAAGKPVLADSVPSVPRLRLEPERSRGTLLDGGWWPRSGDPAAEFPGLIRAIDDRCGRVTRLMLGPAGWDSQPRRLSGAGRVVKIGWFSGQPAGLLTAFCGNGDRTDLLVVPPGTAEADALAAMELAASAANRIHAPDILTTVTRRPAPPPQTEPELSAWEGRLAGDAMRPDRPPGRLPGRPHDDRRP